MIYKNIHIKLLVMLITVLIYGSVKAQTINISDAVFAKYIYETFPLASPELGKLDTTIAKGITGIFNIQSLGIKNVDEIKYFQSLNGIDAKYNDISYFPKLKDFNNLKYIYISYNKLKTAPDISSIYSLVTLNIRHNYINSFPEIGSLPNLKTIIADYNLIDKLPDFSNLPSLDSVNLKDNILNWSELIKLTDYPGFGTIFHFFRQKDLTPTTINHVYKGESISFEFPGPLDTTELSFRWHQNNEWNNVIIGATQKQYTIDSVVVNSNYYEVSSNYKGVNEWNGYYLISGENLVISYNCPVADELAYTVSFDCELGYNINFSTLSVKYDTLLPNYTYSFNLIDSDNNITQTIESGITYNIEPGNYTVQFTNNNSCSSFFDTVINIANYPDIIDVDFLAYENCKESIIEITDLEYGTTLTNPKYSIKNSSSGNYTYIDINKEYPVEHGENKLIVDGGKYCYDSIDIYSAPFIPECNCIAQVKTELTYDTNCKYAELAYTEISSPISSRFYITAKNTYTSKIDTLTNELAEKLNFGSYVISIIDDDLCKEIIEDNLELKKPESCDLILYHNVEGTADTHFINGSGSVKLINEKGKIIYTKTLPTEISVYDNGGSVLPVGLYILLYDDGASQSLTIVW